MGGENLRRKLFISVTISQFNMPTTITIKEDTKKILSRMKGEEDWDTFLKKLTKEYLRMKRELARKKLKELFIEETRVKRWAREY